MIGSLTPPREQSYWPQPQNEVVAIGSKTAINQKPHEKVKFIIEEAESTHLLENNIIGTLTRNLRGIAGRVIDWFFRKENKDKLIKSLNDQSDNCQVILVPGFMGWAEEDLGDLSYFGGFKENIPAQLREKGLPVCTAAISPFASNWDRAAEIYAFIKGGRVDYGAYHANHHQHERYGPTFPGVLPTWGQSSQNCSKPRALHFIAHSQGVQTVRMLIKLLVEGDADEIQYAEEIRTEISPLFTGGKEKWVKSLTSVAGIMDGTSVVPALKNSNVPVLSLFTLLNSTIKSTGFDRYYNLGLEKWQLLKKPDESYWQFIGRLCNSPFLKGTDNPMYDLSPEGAAQLNGKTSCYPHIYYFSLGISASQRQGENHRPNPSNSIVGQILGRFAGTFQDPQSAAGIDHSWLENDGVVNTRSTVAPTLNSSDRVTPWNPCAHPHPGVWNYIGTLIDRDHVQVLGLFDNKLALPLYHFLVKNALQVN